MGVVAINPDKSYESASRQAVALDLFQKAYDLQMRGEYKRALNVYQHSIELNPTAQAYTFLGWTYSFLGDFQQAIRSCVKAIGIDPEFGNPYNDIGAYLMELGRAEDAMFWLKRATQAPKYECYQYPWYNMGRIYESRGDLAKARTCYAQSVKACRHYTLARNALLRVISINN